MKNAHGGAICDTERGLLWAVHAEPADDTPRLVYADWLEENGRPDRAAFIRVQCELMGAERGLVDLLNEETPWEECTELSGRWCPNCGDCSCRDPEDSLSDDGCPLHSADSRHCCQDDLEERMDALRWREGELLNDDNRTAWFAVPGLGVQLEGDGTRLYWWVQPGGPRIEATVSRGFVASVTVPTLEVLLGGECEFCRGRGHFQTSGSYSECPGCRDDTGKGTGRTPGIIGELFAAHPVTSVRVTDREPEASEQHVGWFRWYIGDLDEDPSCLPDDMYSRLQGEYPESRHGRSLQPYWQTAEAALSALSNALVRLGRERAVGWTHECGECRGTGCPYCGGSKINCHESCPVCPTCKGTGSIPGLPPLPGRPLTDYEEAAQ